MGTAAAAVLVVAGGVAVLDDRTDHRRRRPAAGRRRRPRTRPRRPRSRAPRGPTLAGEFRGAPFWWAPPAELDAELPGPPGPRAARDAVDGRRGARDDACRTTSTRCSARPGSSTGCSPTGGSSSVDLSDRLGPVGDEAGNDVQPAGTQERLARRHAGSFFRQPGRVEVWDLPSNSWRSRSRRRTTSRLSGSWTAGSGPATVRRPIGRNHGPVRTSSTRRSSSVPAGSAELDFTGGSAVVPGADEPGHYANPELLVAVQDGSPSVLGIGIDGRSKVCCALDRLVQPRLRAVRSVVPVDRTGCWPGGSGTPDLYRVSEYTDFPRRGSCVQLGGERVHRLRAVSRSRNARSRPSRAWSRSRRVATTAARNASAG